MEIPLGIHQRSSKYSRFRQLCRNLTRKALGERTSQRESRAAGDAKDKGIGFIEDSSHIERAFRELYRLLLSLADSKARGRYKREPVDETQTIVESISALRKLGNHQH